MDKPTATITIDGVRIETEPGRNLVQVANENGIFIPSLCYFEHIEPPLGTCRVCTCRINGVPGPACTEKVRDGMVVEATTAELVEMREAGYSESDIVEVITHVGMNILTNLLGKAGRVDIDFPKVELSLAA